jgi:hypothetical protein
MTEQITKYDKYLAELEENIRFYISTPERFAEALIFAKKLEAFADMIKEKVKSRGYEIMSEKDLKQIDFGNFRVVQIDPTTVDEYSVYSLFNSVEPEVAKALCKVNGAKLKLWLKKSKIEGELLAKITEGRVSKPRKGYIKLLEIKPE